MVVLRYYRLLKGTFIPGSVLVNFWAVLGPLYMLALDKAAVLAELFWYWMILLGTSHLIFCS